MSNYDDLARGRTVVPLKSAPGVTSPTQLTKKYTPQSYFDSTLLENAILTQSGSIVSFEESQASGYGVGLHPSSQTPVTVEFRLGSGTSSGPLVLRPGQIVTPMGFGPDPKGGLGGGAFVGFRYGLPFGWLGGGIATLIVFHTPHAGVNWGAPSPEIVFHRVRVPILQPADLTSAGSNNNARNNWPGRFPWTKAYRGTGKVPQVGEGVIAIEPTRTVMTLRGVSALATAQPMRMILQGSNEGVDSAGAAVLTDPVFDDVTWRDWTDVGTSGNLANVEPSMIYTGPLARMVADDGGLALVDLSGSSALSGGYVDFVRYGRL